MNKLGEYSDVYLKSYVTLLSDIFDNLISVCLQAYKMNLAQPYTSRGCNASQKGLNKPFTMELE